MTEEEWDGWRKIIWAKHLDEMEVIGTGMFSVGVPVEADPEFKAYVFAAGVTHSMGNRSIDGQLRRHREEWIRRFRPDRVHPGSQELLIKKVREQALSRVDELCTIDLRTEPAGAVAAANVLIRLASTFRGALQLIRVGFAFEAEAVVRLGFEQVAWAFVVAPLSDPDEIARTSATKAVSQLRELVPAAGRIYGRLSNLAHVAPSTHHRFVSIAEDESVRIRVEAHDAAKESLFLLILLLDALYVASEFRFHVHGIRCTSLDAARAHVSPERPAIALIREFAQVLPPDTEATLSAWSG